MFHALDHVVIAVRDLDAARDRYARLLGREASWRGAHPGEGTANALFRLENGYLELIAATGDGATARILAGVLESRGEGVVGLAFGTDDLDAACATLRARGAEPGEPTPGEGREATSGTRRAWRRAVLPADVARGLHLFAIEHASPANSLPAAPPMAGTREDARVTALDHVVVLSGDLDDARRRYGDLLGLRLALDRSFEKRGVRILFFRVGGVTVEVAGPRVPSESEGGADRFGGLAYRVPDVDAARRRLAEAFDVSEVRSGAKPGTRVCSVRDGTCGVPTLLIGPG